MMICKESAFAARDKPVAPADALLICGCDGFAGKE
jgi:hypothetical protein